MRLCQNNETAHKVFLVQRGSLHSFIYFFKHQKMLKGVHFIDVSHRWFDFSQGSSSSDAAAKPLYSGKVFLFSLSRWLYYGRTRHSATCLPAPDCTSYLKTHPRAALGSMERCVCVWRVCDASLIWYFRYLHICLVDIFIQTDLLTFWFSRSFIHY